MALICFCRNVKSIDNDDVQILEKFSIVEHNYHRSPEGNQLKAKVIGDKSEDCKDIEEITEVSIDEVDCKTDGDISCRDLPLNVAVCSTFDDVTFQKESDCISLMKVEHHLKDSQKHFTVENLHAAETELFRHGAHVPESIHDLNGDSSDVGSGVENVNGFNGMDDTCKEYVKEGAEICSMQNLLDVVKPKKDPGIYQYICDFCDEKDRREFSSEHELSRHKIKHHWDVSHRCTFCGRKFCSQAGLRTHMKLHTGSKLTQRRKKFKCTDCDRLFYTAAALEGHKSKHTGLKPWECNTCGQKFTMRSSMERHQYLHIGYKPFLCDFCGKGFIKSHNLTEHVLSAHRDAEHEYECVLCEDRFRHKSEIEKHALEIHQLTNLEELSMMVKQQDAFLCDFCGKNLISAKALKMHQKVHSAKRQHCETCDKTFASISALNVHKRIHSGEKPYVCGLCHRGFLQKPSLESHLATHSIVRPYICIICSKSFANKSQLNQHALLHGGERAYTCGICRKQFTSKSYFILHNRTHTGDKPHVCSACGCTFTMKHHLKRHMRVHTGERPFACQICNKNYKNNVDLRYHYIRFHKLEFEQVSINNRSKYIFKLDGDNTIIN